ncbi:transmembrane protein, putative [Medicago truncatula]|uniref:Transmembrane protein, putative n=1 Tax=Medicago truncatula TaxID=3880 RepID=A0A072UXD7_MEDTR|nr:transmembrane protein, putative [Medicago truncatula]
MSQMILSILPWLDVVGQIGFILWFAQAYKGQTKTKYQYALATQETSMTENVQDVNAEVHDATPICLQLRKELDIVTKYLIQWKDVYVPFTPYPTKKLKKKLNKLNSYNTRSKDKPKGG